MGCLKIFSVNGKKAKRDGQTYKRTYGRTYKRTYGRTYGLSLVVLSAAVAAKNCVCIYSRLFFPGLALECEGLWRYIFLILRLNA